MEFSRQEYWSGLSCPPPGDLLDTGIKPVSLMSPALAEGFIFNIPHKYSYETHRYLVPKDLPSNIAFQMLITVFLSLESLCPGASAFWPLFTGFLQDHPVTQNSWDFLSTFFSVRFHIPSFVFILF